MQVKLKDIADKSGYSITTVSRALAGYADVNEDTRKQIIELAMSMGYQPNQVARQLRSQRTNTIGMVIPYNDHGFSDDFFSELMMGVGHAASKHGYDLLVSAQLSPENEIDAYYRIVGGNRVDGVVLARTRKHDPRIDYLQQTKLPFVVSGRRAPGMDSNFPYIDVDSQTGIKMLVQHFVELGHRKIALLLPPEEMAFTGYRLHGYQDGLTEARIPVEEKYTVYSNLQREGGYNSTKQLLAQSPEITGIIACNDLMALGAISAAQDRGLKVGKDIAIAGFDDIPASAFSNPPLTTIRQPIYNIGERLIEMLMQVIQKQPLDAPHILLQPTLVIRESSGGYSR